MSLFEHLLPHGRAWRINKNKPLRQFFDALSVDFAGLYDSIWLDIFPKTTNSINQWEYLFNVFAGALTEQQRRDRLSGLWQAVGGQDPVYLQRTLRANGFDIYIHEWWEPSSHPAVNDPTPATPRNPIDNLRQDSRKVIGVVDCGESTVQCGESVALCGESKPWVGYALVNGIYESVEAYVQCGEMSAQCGEPLAQCRNILGYVSRVKKYTIPANSEYWPYFLYICGETFGEPASIPASRRNEFEELCLRICPAQQWLGLIVKYV